MWTDDTQAMVGERGQFHVRASKGIHLVVPRDRIHSSTGLILRTEKSVLFVIPWGRHWIIGTTDTDWALDKAHPAATRADIDYLLDHVNSVLATPLTREDVEGVYAGLRPLLAGESESTSKLSREHVVAHSAPGPGRRRRRQVHDLPGDGQGRRRRGGPGARRPGRRLDAPTRPAARRRRLPGGLEPAADARPRARACTSPGSSTCCTATARSPRRSSTWSPSDPSSGARSTGADDYLEAEVVYAASHEGALHLDDVLTRRTRISIEAWDRGVSAPPRPPPRLDGAGPRLGRGRAPRRRSSTTSPGSRPSGSARRMPDDASADAARRSGPDGTL